MTVFRCVRCGSYGCAPETRCWNCDPSTTKAEMKQHASYLMKRWRDLEELVHRYGLNLSARRPANTTEKR